MSNSSQTRRKLLPVVFVLLLLIGLSGLLLAMVLRPKRTRAIQSVLSGTPWANSIPLFVAMAKHESANFTSNVYKNLHNIFGMNVPTKRPFIGDVGTSTPEGGTYARYSSDVQSVKDLVEWLKYTSFPHNFTSIEAFVEALKKRGYFTDSYTNYLNGVYAWYNR